MIELIEYALRHSDGEVDFVGRIGTSSTSDWFLHNVVTVSNLEQNFDERNHTTQKVNFAVQFFCFFNTLPLFINLNRHPPYTIRSSERA